MQIQFHHMSTQMQVLCQDCKLLKFSSNCVVDIILELSNDVIFAFSKSACLVELTTHAFSVSEQRVICQHLVKTQRVGVDEDGSGCVDSAAVFVKYFIDMFSLTVVTADELTRTGIKCMFFSKILPILLSNYKTSISKMDLYDFSHKRLNLIIFICVIILFLSTKCEYYIIINNVFRFKLYNQISISIK